ncbi:hypothetical protein FB45DRAFT_861113 [Roridomyces roridus]|uniref:Uncharacterized protein n=1 Tax=Roridomyces roridus TaxID=1738132 RepID=A0AAD7FXK5_9AGAR|nr:hypothetical protein FB45DRAFT_861113 [Roridomyces roridus]
MFWSESISCIQHSKVSTILGLGTVAASYGHTYIRSRLFRATAKLPPGFQLSTISRIDIASNTIAPRRRCDGGRVCRPALSRCDISLSERQISSSWVNLWAWMPVHPSQWRLEAIRTPVYGRIAPVPYRTPSQTCCIVPAEPYTILAVSGLDISSRIEIIYQFHAHHRMIHQHLQCTTGAGKKILINIEFNVEWAGAAPLQQTPKEVKESALWSRSDGSVRFAKPRNAEPERPFTFSSAFERVRTRIFPAIVQAEFQDGGFRFNFAFAFERVYSRPNAEPNLAFTFNNLSNLNAERAFGSPTQPQRCVHEVKAATATEVKALRVTEARAGKAGGKGLRKHLNRNVLEVDHAVGTGNAYVINGRHKKCPRFHLLPCTAELKKCEFLGPISSKCTMACCLKSLYRFNDALFV